MLSRHHNTLSSAGAAAGAAAGVTAAGVTAAFSVQVAPDRSKILPSTFLFFQMNVNSSFVLDRHIISVIGS
ncbi:MAG TPA: hypothetical protein VEH06_09280 [Candidatus Bathyarchaeia archaeon]|nr:hypothetical protein [Candidatus Bathyarchaeia archaeon]